VTAIAGILYIVIVAVGGFLMVRARPAASLSPADLLACRLVVAFALFFIGFDLPGVVGLFIRGEWVNFANAVLVAVILVVAGCSWVRQRAPLSREVVGRPASPLSVPAFNGTTRLVVVAVGGGFLLVAGLLIVGFPRGFEANAYHLPSAVNFFRDDGSLHVLGYDVAAYAPRQCQPLGWVLAAAPAGACRIPREPPFSRALRLHALSALPLFGCRPVCRRAGLLRRHDDPAVWILRNGVGSGRRRRVLRPSGALAGSVAACGDAWLAGSGRAASGIAYGFKPLHLVIAILVGFLILVGRAPVGTRPGPRARVAHSSSFAAGFIALAGIWLLRYQVELGNPFYPIPLGGLPELFGFSPAPDWPLDEFKYAEFEWVPTTWRWLVYPWVEGHKFHQNFKFSSGLGPFFAATVPMAWIAFGIMLPLDLRRCAERGDGDRSTRVLYVCGTVIFLAWWVSGSRQPRYAMMGIAVLMPLAAVLLGSSSGRLRPHTSSL
jgi:hypothetical protein